MSKAPPASITFMGRPFSVRVVGGDQLLGHATEPTALGAAFLNEGAIAIRAGQTTHEERDTMLHELIHVVLGLGQAENDAHFQGGDASERVVSILAAGLLAIFWENPALLTYLARP